MLSRKLFLTGTLAVAVIGLVAGALVADNFLHSKVENTSQAAWKEVYKQPRELVRSVDAIVLATAVDVQPGRTAFSEDGEDALSFEVARFAVVKGLKGAEAGEEISVERAAASEGGVFLDYDGGRFEIGNTYLLFLKQQEDGGPYFYQVNNQGRYRVAAGRLHADDDDDDVVTHFHNRTVQEGLSLVRANLREGRLAN